MIMQSATVTFPQVRASIEPQAVVGTVPPSPRRASTLHLAMIRRPITNNDNAALGELSLKTLAGDWPAHDRSVVSAIS